MGRAACVAGSSFSANLSVLPLPQWITTSCGVVSLRRYVFSQPPVCVMLHPSPGTPFSESVALESSMLQPWPKSPTPSLARLSYVRRTDSGSPWTGMSMSM